MWQERQDDKRVKFPVRLFLANQIAKKFQNITVPDVTASSAMTAWRKPFSPQTLSLLFTFCELCT